MEFIKEYWFLISGIIIPMLTYYIGNIQSKIKKDKEDMVEVKRGICAIQRNYILRSCDEYKSREHCPIEVKETLNEMYLSYHELGGNGFIAEMVRQINLLPEHSEEIKLANKKKTQTHIQ